MAISKSKKNINTRKFKKQHSRVNKLRKNNGRNSRKVNRKLTKLRGGAGFVFDEWKTKISVECIEIETKTNIELDECKIQLEKLRIEVLQIKDLTGESIKSRSNFINNQLDFYICEIIKQKVLNEYNKLFGTDPSLKEESVLQKYVEDINILIKNKETEIKDNTLTNKKPIILYYSILYNTDLLKFLK